MISGEGFTLRKLKPEDASSLAKHANNFKVWLNLKNALPHPYHESDAEWFINHVSEENPTQKMGIIVDGEVAGVIGIVLMDDVYVKTVNLGYWLGEAHWGKGLMTKVVGAFITYVWQEFDINKIASGAFGHNTGSIRVLEKNGFNQEGLFKEHVFKNGEFLDEVKFGLLRRQE